MASQLSSQPPSSTETTVDLNMKPTTTSVRVPRRGPTFSKPQELVTFHIGSSTEHQIFLVHKEVATFYSSVLRAAFNSDFVEGSTQSYTLEDVEPGVFRLMVQWLYGQKINYFLTQAESDLFRGTQDHTEEQRKLIDGKIEERQHLLARLWVLADRLAIPLLQNEAIDELDSIRRGWKDSVAWRCLNYVYENTTEKSTLRWLILTQCICFIPPSMMIDHEEYLPKRFLLDRLLNFHYGDAAKQNLENRRRFRKHFHVPVEDGCEEA